MDGGEQEGTTSYSLTPRHVPSPRIYVEGSNHFYLDALYGRGVMQLRSIKAIWYSRTRPQFPAALMRAVILGARYPRCGKLVAARRTSLAKHSNPDNPGKVRLRMGRTDIQKPLQPQWIAFEDTDSIH